VPLQSTDTVHVDENEGQVHFRPLHKSNEGRYTCKASNDVGQATASDRLTVFGQCCSAVDCLFVCLRPRQRTVSPVLGAYDRIQYDVKRLLSAEKNSCIRLNA